MVSTAALTRSRSTPIVARRRGCRVSQSPYLIVRPVEVRSLEGLLRRPSRVSDATVTNILSPQPLRHPDPTLAPRRSQRHSLRNRIALHRHPLCLCFDEAPPEPFGYGRRFIGIVAAFRQEHVAVVEDLDFAARGLRADEHAVQPPGRPEQMSVLRGALRVQRNAILDTFRPQVTPFCIGELSDRPVTSTVQSSVNSAVT